jgi:hypothetical protein
MPIESVQVLVDVMQALEKQFKIKNIEWLKILKSIDNHSIHNKKKTDWI